MPGENCSIYNCPTSRKHKISIWKLPAAKDEFHKKWRKDLEAIILSARVMDQNLKNQVANDRLHICERHFSQDQLYIYPTRKTMKEGAIPSLNLPTKSHPSSLFSSSSPPSRSTEMLRKKEACVDKQAAISTIAKPCFKNFDGFVKRVETLKLPTNWTISIKNEFVEMSHLKPDLMIPEYQIFVDTDLKFIVRIFGWLLPKEHDLSISNSFEFVTPSFLIRNKLSGYSLCQGIDATSVSNSCYISRHVIPKKFNYLNWKQSNSDERKYQLEYLRSNDCQLLIQSEKVCKNCHKLSINTQIELRRKFSKETSPISAKAPITKTSIPRLKATIQTQRITINKTTLACAQMAERIKQMKLQIERLSCTVDADLDQDFVNIFKGVADEKIPPFMKLFWEEQQKYLRTKSSKHIRYHPTIIKYCLAIQSKSPSAYKELRFNAKEKTGVLFLPSQRTLRDYKNVIRPQRGFNPALISDLTKQVENFSEQERFTVLLFDEMKVQEDLVWDKHTGELIGFVDLGDTDVNYANLENVQEIASHVMVFLIKSIVNPLSFSFATFATHNLSASQIYAVYWKAVAILEISCKLKVIATTCDGASQNRTFFKMHKGCDTIIDFEEEDDYPDISEDIVYRVKNRFTTEARFIWFFSDPPHLVKTARNCLMKSGKTRHMWKDGQDMLWSHISQLYYEDLEYGLKLLPKLTREHIHLTSYSVMNVRLAAQVLSESVGKVVLEFGPNEAVETGWFCRRIDEFFDCCNVKNTKEWKTKLKPYLKPYRTLDDERYDHLKSEMIAYEEWKEQIAKRDSELYSDEDKKKMFISTQTYQGILITSKSLIECVKFLIREGNIKFVLTERFCQDDLENYFGKQRAIGGSKTHPRVVDVSNNDSTIKANFFTQPNEGANVKPSQSKWDNAISDEPLKKKKRPNRDKDSKSS